MNASTLLENLRNRGAIVRVDCGDILVSAPKGMVTADERASLALAKPELMRLLSSERWTLSNPLVDYAASVLPSIKMTLRETGDTKRDFDLVARLRRAIQEYQPGGNHIYLRIVTKDGRAVIAEWRALADQGLRIALANILARASVSDGAT